MKLHRTKPKAKEKGRNIWQTALRSRTINKYRALPTTPKVKRSLLIICGPSFCAAYLHQLHACIISMMNIGHPFQLIADQWTREPPGSSHHRELLLLLLISSSWLMRTASSSEWYWDGHWAFLQQKHTQIFTRNIIFCRDKCRIHLLCCHQARW